MKRTLWTAITVAVMFGTSASATGLYDCEETDQSEWLSSEALTEKLESEGWAVRRMKVDGGCWEVYGTDPEGRRVEGYFHPVTGDVKLIAQRGTILFQAEDG